MYISKETAEQTERRLLKVLSQAEIKVFDGSYAFEECPVGAWNGKAKDTSLAFVRDEEVWMDNSGFVGWLATYLKQKLGTGVFVTCGQNSNKGGIFDYWGCPYEIRDAFIEEIISLIQKGKQLTD
jgi:hypothetical protein